MNQKVELLEVRSSTNKTILAVTIFFFTFVKVYAGKKSNTAGQKSNHRFIVLSGVSIQNNLCILNSFYPLPPIKRITMPIV